MNENDPMGPPSDFGWARCHGCNRMQDDWGRIRHAADCPGVCIRENCEWHS